jgi:threonine/homoserine/homoserine lactone efflux protein
MTNVLLFMMAAATIFATPGPTNVLLSTSAALVGVRRSLALLGAELSGYLFSISLVVCLSSSILVDLPAISLVLRMFIALYLVYLASRLWIFDWSTARDQITSVPITPKRVFITTLLNPKVLVFAFALLPPLDNLHQIVTYASAFASVNLVVSFAWLVLASSIKGIVLRGRENLLSRAAAFVLVAFAAGIGGSALAGWN